MNIKEGLRDPQFNYLNYMAERTDGLICEMQEVLVPNPTDAAIVEGLKNRPTDVSKHFMEIIKREGKAVRALQGIKTCHTMTISLVGTMKGLREGKIKQIEELQASVRQDFNLAVEAFISDPQRANRALT